MMRLVAVAVAILPVFVASDYRLFQLTMVVVYAIAIIGLDIVTGYAGQISLGHGVFYAVGAYAAAIAMSRYGVPYWATLPVAAVLCAVIGCAVALPALRLGGLHLALTTFALAAAVPQFLKYQGFARWTGGVQGLVIEQPDPPFGLALNQDQYLYLFTLAVGGLAWLLAWNLVRGRIGRAMMAVRDDPVAAEAMGIDIALTKTATFAASAMVTGVAGALGAIAVQFVAPDSFSWFLSITLFVGLVVGGVGSIWGAVFGGGFVVFMPDIAGRISTAAPNAIYGLVLVGCLYAMPSGLAGFVRKRLPWQAERK